MLCNDCESFFKQKWNRAPFLKDYHGHFHNNFLRTENEVASCELCRYLSESSLSTQLKDDSAHLEYGFFARGPHEIEHQLFIGIGSKNHIGRRGLDFTLMGESDFKIHNIMRSHITSASTDSDESIQKLRNWITVCNTEHTLCRKTKQEARTWHPTRLVAIPSSPGCSIIRVEDDPAVLKDARHCTLSYFWGHSPSFRMLKVETFEELKSGLDVSQIPKTFQDAVKLVKMLGYKYIWIDAYCIIQGSPGGKDWHHESTTMSEVYSNSELNIAASASDSVEGGLFRDRNPIFVNDISIQPDQKGSDSFSIIPTDHWMRKMQYQPLNLRAWAFQERRLSSRTIHCTTTELIWECNSMCASEIFPNGKKSDDRWHTQSKVAKIRNGKNYDPDKKAEFWRWLVWEYSKGFLTKETDRLVALAGLAKSLISTRDGNDYFVGLWKWGQFRDLLWQALDVEGSFRSQTYIAPSWSWASILAGRTITRANLFPYPRAVAKVVDVQTTTVTDAFGSVTVGFIRLQARVCPVTVSKLPPSDDIRISNERWALNIAGSTSSLESISPAIEYEEDYASRQIYCVEIAIGGLKFMSQPTKGVPFISAGLILEPTDEKGEYCRLGEYQLNHQYNHDGWGWTSVKRKARRLYESRTLDIAYDAARLDEQLFQSFDEINQYTISIV